MTPRRATGRDTTVGYRRLKTRRPAARVASATSARSAMPDILAIHADARGDVPAVIVDASGGARPSATSFRELNALVNRAVHGLAAIGARPRDRLVWCGPNSLEVLVTIHAARKASLT